MTRYIDADQGKGGIFPSETQTEFLPFFLRFQENMRFMMNEQERGRDNA